MPIYEYQCPACHHELEVLQKMSDAPLTECPNCKKEGLRRLVSAAGFQLKGTGWYATDYGKGAKQKEGDVKDNNNNKEAANAESDKTKNTKQDKSDESTKTKTQSETSSSDKKTGD